MSSTAIEKIVHWIGPALGGLAITALLVGSDGIAGRWDRRAAVAVAPFYEDTRRPYQAIGKEIARSTAARLRMEDRRRLLRVVDADTRLREPFGSHDFWRGIRRAGAEWVVVGQIRSDRDGMHIKHRLVRASDRREVWAHTFYEPSIHLGALARIAETTATAVAASVQRH